MVAEQIRQKNIIGRKGNRSHVKHVKKQIRERRKNEKRKICPKCGEKLIPKNGKYGKFYGCQNFPKCRYTYKARG